MCPIPGGFRDRVISLYSCKIVGKETLCILFNMDIYCFQVPKSVQFTQNNTFSKIPQSTSRHFATHVRTWHVARLSASSRSFTLAITPITRLSTSSHVSTSYSQLTLHTDSHASYSGAGVKDNFGLQIQTPVQ